MCLCVWRGGGHIYMIYFPLEWFGKQDLGLKKLLHVSGDDPQNRLEELVSRLPIRFGVSLDRSSQSE